jgi:hypothetical protein
MSTRALTTGRATGFMLTAGIGELTLTTAYIHWTLGGLLFTLNAVGYAVLAAALAVGASGVHPIIDRFSWIPRIALAAYTVATIGGYLAMGPFFSLGWVAKGIEVAILILLAADVARVYRSPAGLIRAAAASLSASRRAPTA